MIFDGYFREFVVKVKSECTDIRRQSDCLQIYLSGGMQLAALIFLRGNITEGSMNYIRVCDDVWNDRLTKVVHPFRDVYTIRINISQILF